MNGAQLNLEHDGGGYTPSPDPSKACTVLLSITSIALILKRTGSQFQMVVAGCSLLRNARTGRM